MPQRSRSGEYVVVGCLFSPAAFLFLIGLLFPARGAHGNGLIFLLAILAALAAMAIVVLQLLLPKPPEPPASRDEGGQPPEG